MTLLESLLSQVTNATTPYVLTGVAAVPWTGGIDVPKPEVKTGGAAACSFQVSVCTL
jgi:hypothetical protein